MALSKRPPLPIRIGIYTFTVDNAITLQHALNLPFAGPDARLNRRYHTQVKLHMTPTDHSAVLLKMSPAPRKPPLLLRWPSGDSLTMNALPSVSLISH